MKLHWPVANRAGAQSLCIFIDPAALGGHDAVLRHLANDAVAELYGLQEHQQGDHQLGGAFVDRPRRMDEQRIGQCDDDGCQHHRLVDFEGGDPVRRRHAIENIGARNQAE